MLVDACSVKPAPAFTFGVAVAALAAGGGAALAEVESVTAEGRMAKSSIEHDCTEEAVTRHITSLYALLTVKLNDLRPASVDAKSWVTLTAGLNALRAAQAVAPVPSTSSTVTDLAPSEAKVVAVVPSAMRATTSIPNEVPARLV